MDCHGVSLLLALSMRNDVLVSVGFSKKRHLVCDVGAIA